MIKKKNAVLGRVHRLTILVGSHFLQGNQGKRQLRGDPEAEPGWTVGAGHGRPGERAFQAEGQQTQRPGAGAGGVRPRDWPGQRDWSKGRVAGDKAQKGAGPDDAGCLGQQREFGFLFQVW